VERADGETILRRVEGRPDPLREALEAAGFVVTPRGLRLRG
jgi:ATP-dependent helicase Lhr and Lhr-like helicase